MILESRVDEAEINEEIRSALAALNPARQAGGGGGLEGGGTECRLSPTYGLVFPRIPAQYFC